MSVKDFFQPRKCFLEWVYQRLDAKAGQTLNFGQRKSTGAQFFQDGLYDPIRTRSEEASRVPSPHLSISNTSSSDVSSGSTFPTQMDPSQPIITHATREDVPEILAMIRELAIYEDALDSVLATEQTLLSTLSFATKAGAPASTPGYAKCLLIRIPVSETNKSPKPSNNSSVKPSSNSLTSVAKTTTVAGMALYFNNYSTWRSAPGVYLEDLFVRPAYRARGYGKLLIGALAKECKRIGGGRVEWCCLKWNEKSLGFYRSLGAVEMEGWVTLRLDGEAMEKMAGVAEEEADVVVGGRRS